MESIEKPASDTVKVNWWKTGVFAAAAVGLFFIGRCNGIRSVIKTEGVDTVISYTVTDTVYVPQVVRVSYPEIVTNTIYQPKIVYRTDTLTRINPADTGAILKDYYASRFYSDTQKLTRGTVIIEDDISQNRITKRRLQTFGTDTVIKETIVIRPPQKLILFFGVSASGSRKNPFHLAGIDLTLKAVNDRQYTIGANVDKDGKLYGEFGLKWPFRFK